MSYKKYDGTLFSISSYACGVLVKEKTMKRLAGLYSKHLEEVKTILKDEAERGNVFPYMWTLAYPDGKQTNVTYIDESRSVDSAIRCATLCNQPIESKLVFISSSMDDAKKQAEEYYEQQKGTNV
jgi:hypothetical protein